ncbi:MAG: hypothetical protein HKN16_04550 [Saprospiraceae bacterium]|nr:hypothetical protein [Saprospiraceae bacterium]
MILKRSFLTIGFAILMVGAMLANINPEAKKPKPSSNTEEARPRFDCASSTAQIDQDINNVRARLTTGGDVWWDGSDGKYVVPKVPAGIPEVSSLFAGAVWLGGRDPGGNLKIAAQQYGRNSGSFDFWPGPLLLDSSGNGVTNAAFCAQWDRFFTVSGSEVREHRANHEKAISEGVDYDPDDIPEAVKGWPALGNEFFEDVHGFPLPFDEANGLAGFWDYGPDGLGTTQDGLYNPEKGDFPIVEIRKCNEFPLSFPDQMIFWIYNDNGNIHQESGADPIGMEVQVQAFAFESNDEINNMTFQRYKLINRALEDLTDTYFAMWIDGDLGCYTDDYIGCDTTRSLAYLYNEDQLDGQTGCTCPGGVNTYCDKIPILGVDYFRGPLDENFQEIGMSSFTYFNNPSVGNWPPGTTDPGNANEYYNYLSGFWRDGTPFTLGGTGYDPASTNFVDYAFVDEPDEQSGWSMCTSGLGEGDRRTIQASGPFTLKPTAKNELIIGVVWIPELQYPCPDISKLLLVDDLAQNIFDNCFEIPQGPSAPDMDWVELDREVVAVITNKPGNADNNNINENYAEWDLRSPGAEDDSTYFFKFEGYKVYQLKSSTSTDLANPEEARLVRQMDINNDIDIVFNWSSVSDPSGGLDIWFPVEQVNGNNTGIDHSFSILEDRFASGDSRLINHKEYFYTSIAYAYNNWAPFEQNEAGIFGQRSPYLEGRLNKATYTVIPRPINDLVLNTFYGDGPQVEGLDGGGSGGNFIEIEDETVQAILDGSFDGTVKFKPGQAPVNVKIINPIEVVDGDYTLRFYDDSSNSSLGRYGRWNLTHEPSGTVIESDKPLDTLNEQIIPEFGISIKAGAVDPVGTSGIGDNGTVGVEVEFGDNGPAGWFAGLPANTYTQTAPNQPDELLDQNQAFTNPGGPMAPGFFVPSYLASPTSQMRISPAHENNTVSSLVRSGSSLADLNNVDIVFTRDKANWSRCIVVETSSTYYHGQQWEGVPSEGDRDHLDIRAGASVTKEADGDGKAVVDGAESRPGFGWFPGYAIDVETGERLNIFFGENSSYSCEAFQEVALDDLCAQFADANNEGTGRDMMWNPTTQATINTPFPRLLQAYLGGHHWIYVTRTPYDGCESLYQDFRPEGNILNKSDGMKKVTWVCEAFMTDDLLSYGEGLIPSDLTYKLRVAQPLKHEGAGENGGFPMYRFTIDGKEAQELTSQDQLDEQLEGIRIVPNPYYGYSNYEVSQFATTVKLTNLPNTCDVTIYSLEGKFIRSYKRNVGPNTDATRNGILAKQVTPALEWDLKNAAGIPVASGTYLIHVNAPGIGETVVKFFAVQRQFDPSGL